MRIILVGAVLALASAVGVLPGSPSTAHGDDSMCDVPSSGAVDQDDLPEGSSAEECDAIGRVVESEDGLRVEVPPPGYTVVIEELLPGDESLVFGVEVATEGEISYVFDSADSMPVDYSDPGVMDDYLGRVASKPECQQEAYNLMDVQQYGPFEWYMNDLIKPAGASSAEFKDVISRSIGNIVNASNNCGLPDNVDIGRSYQGLTTKRPIKDGDCSVGDGLSVVGAGNLAGQAWAPGVALGVACFSSREEHAGRDSLTEVDVILNTGDYAFTFAPNAPGCTNPAPKSRAFDVESVLTHEFGHAFGLDHVSEKNFPTMTMSTQVTSCDSSQRTLGKGDVLGLEKLY